ncbi:MAG: hypothetical protein B6D37_05270 [Sphingobacteriales bacterium UTBCD1]|jgi:hypothetical protein|nr:MAG: hypothetical protein B6D37_05270 [Sphingobacteriales bacterium UTBCD1]
MKQFIITLIATVFLFSGCGPSTKITSSWKAQDAYPKKFNKIVVLGLITDADRTVRENMEQNIAANLRDLGYNAVCSCDEYSPKAFEGMSEEQALQKLRNSGVDAVLTITLLDKTKEQYYVPGKIYYTPYYIYHNRFWGYYRVMYNRIYSPGYYSQNTKYFWESNFYDMPADQLIYSVQSQSFDPASTESVSREYGTIIIKDMVRNNILANQKGVTTKPM